MKLSFYFASLIVISRHRAPECIYQDDFGESDQIFEATNSSDWPTDFLFAKFDAFHFLLADATSSGSLRRREERLEALSAHGQVTDASTKDELIEHTKKSYLKKWDSLPVSDRTIRVFTGGDGGSSFQWYSFRPSSSSNALPSTLLDFDYGRSQTMVEGNRLPGWGERMLFRFFVGFVIYAVNDLLRLLKKYVRGRYEARFETKMLVRREAIYKKLLVAEKKLAKIQRVLACVERGQADLKVCTSRYEYTLPCAREELRESVTADQQWKALKEDLRQLVFTFSKLREKSSRACGTSLAGFAQSLHNIAVACLKNLPTHSTRGSKESNKESEVSMPDTESENGEVEEEESREESKTSGSSKPRLRSSSS